MISFKRKQNSQEGVQTLWLGEDKSRAGRNKDTETAELTATSAKTSPFFPVKTKEKLKRCLTLAEFKFPLSLSYVHQSLKLS